MGCPINRLPDTVEKAYEKLLENVNPKQKDKVRTLLHMVFIAQRALTLAEANIALNIRGQFNLNSIERLNLYANRFRDWIVHNCSFFLIDYDGKLYFIHQTAKEFLRSNNSRERYSQISSGHILSQSSAQTGYLLKVALLTWQWSVSKQTEFRWTRKISVRSAPKNPQLERLLN